MWTFPHKPTAVKSLHLQLLRLTEAWLRIAHFLIAAAHLESNRVVTVCHVLSQVTYPIAVFLRGSQYQLALGVSLNLTVLPSEPQLLTRLDGYIADIRMRDRYHAVELTLFFP